MPTCSAFGCSYKSCRKKIPGKTIHRFPFSRPDILKRWVLNMRRKDWKPSHGSVLCSDHFEPECFDRTGQIVRLRQDAVPTIFAFPHHLQKVVKERKLPCRVAVAQNASTSVDLIGASASTSVDVIDASASTSVNSIDASSSVDVIDASASTSVNSIDASSSVDVQHATTSLKAQMSIRDNTYCCVPQCNSKGTRNPELSFHMFPHLPGRLLLPNLSSYHYATIAYIRKRRNEWIRLLRIGKEVSNRMRVCSKHFKETDFTKYFNKGYEPKRVRLRPSAVPSLYLPVTENGGSKKKYQAATKINACKQVSNGSITHIPTTFQKSSLLSKATTKPELETSKASIKDLRHSTIELWQKNEILKKNIKNLKNKGYKEKDCEWFNKALQEHQYLKELGKRIMGRLADVQNTTLAKVQEEFGIR